MTEEPRPPWDDRAWERVEGGVDLAAVDVVACAPDGLIGGGEGLARIGVDGDGLIALDAVGLRSTARGIGLQGTSIFVATTRGGVFVSDDGGRTFREINGWRSLFEPTEADGALEIVVLRDELWGRGTGGALVWSADQGTTWARVLPDYR